MQTLNLCVQKKHINSFDIRNKMNDESMEYEVAKAVSTVRFYRDEKWKKALKLEKNDFQKASDPYDTL